MAGRRTLVSNFLFKMHGAGCIHRAKTQCGYSYLPSVVIYATLYTANFLEAVTKGQQHPLRRIAWLSMCCFLGGWFWLRWLSQRLASTRSWRETQQVSHHRWM
jgi:hypothetical protein